MNVICAFLIEEHKIIARVCVVQEASKGHWNVTKMLKKIIFNPNLDADS